MLKIETITNDRQFRATLGYGELEFKALLSEFEVYYEEKEGKNYEDYVLYLKINVGEDKYPKLDTLEKVLTLILYQMKHGNTYDVLGVIFEISGTVARDYFVTYSTLLDGLLEKKIKTCKRI
jgi:hypothetical protein